MKGDYCAKYTRKQYRETDIERKYGFYLLSLTIAIQAVYRRFLSEIFTNYIEISAIRERNISHFLTKKKEETFSILLRMPPYLTSIKYSTLVYTQFQTIIHARSTYTVNSILFSYISVIYKISRISYNITKIFKEYLSPSFRVRGGGGKNLIASIIKSV